MKVLLLLGPKGGSGKSTLARNLAVAASLDGLSVSAIDTDAQGTLARWGQRRAKAGTQPAIHCRAVAIGQARAALTDSPAIDLVVIDTPTAIEEHPDDFKALVIAADLVLIPSRASLDDVDSVAGFMQVVQDLRRPGAFALNCLRPRVKESDGARRRLGRFGDVLAAALPDSVDVQRAMADGLGVLETGGRGADDMAALWDEVRRRLGLGPGPARREGG